MAKKSVLERNKKREHLAAKYEAERKRLKEIVFNKTLSQNEIFLANQKLALLPRNSSPNRVCNRCLLSGRKRAYYRKFKVSRIVLRELASSGQIPGMKIASW